MCSHVPPLLLQRHLLLGALLCILPFFVFVPKADATEWVIDENFTIHYSANEETLTIEFVLKNYNNGWMGLAFHEFMFPADMIVCWLENNEPICWDAYNPGIPTFANFPAPIQDVDPLIATPNGSVYDNKNNLRNISASNENCHYDYMQT